MTVTKKKGSQKKREHDRSYKGIFSNKKEFLHFLRKYIGWVWTSNIALGDMEKVNKSYVSREYRHLDSDVIYKLKREGRDVYFYVLLEMQSSVDFTMPFRLLRYMVELLNDIFKNTDVKIRERKDFRLPAIIPIVLYNGDDNWTVVRTYREYTEDHELFGNNIIDFSYILFDLKRVNEETILSTKEFLDVAFLWDKIFDRNAAMEDNLNELLKRLEVLAPQLTSEKRARLARWIANKGDSLSDSEIENLLNQSFKKGDKNNMKHAIDIMFDQIVEERLEQRFNQMVEERFGQREEERAKNMARNLLRLDRLTVDEIAKASDLDISTVLMLQSEMA